LNRKDEKNNMASLLTLNKLSDKWEDFNSDFEKPTNCSYIIIWLHTFNSSKINLFLDELNVFKNRF